MSAFSATYLTLRGRMLEAKVKAGKTKLTFTCMKIGDGDTKIEDIDNLDDLKAAKLSLSITSCAVSESDQAVCEVQAIAASNDVESSFRVTELGLYAQDPTDGEILYAVVVDSVPDIMPNKNVISPVNITYQINIVSSNAANIKAVIDPAGIVTVKRLEAHNSDKDAHPSLREEVKKSTLSINAHSGASVLDHPDGSVTTAKIADEAVTPAKLSTDVVKVINDAGLNLLQRSKTYNVGDIAYHKNLPSWARLECVKAGTTGAEIPAAFAQVSAGGVLLADGNVLWIVDDMRDGTPVGEVRGSLYLPAGYVKANGATVQRADYPRLVALVDTYSLWTDDVAANAGLFGRGDGSGTMVLPNWTDRMMQLAGDGAGVSVAAGLPNITGELVYWGGTEFFGSGAFVGSGKSDQWGLGGPVTDKDNNSALFDASRSNPIYGASATVQPPAIKLIPVIRY